MANLFSAVLFALACNLDTVVLAAVFRLRGARLGPAGALIIAAVTTVITVVCLEFGRTAALLLLPGLSRAIGAFALMALGSWFLLDGLRRPRESSGIVPGTAGAKAWIALAAALGVNNAGVGVAAGVGGVWPVLGGAVNFAVTFLCLGLGHRLGAKAEKGVPERYILPASGVFLLVLGLFTLGASLT